MNLKRMIALAGAAMACFSLPANAQVVTGGSTDVTLTAAPLLTGAGLSVDRTGTATVSYDGSGIPTFTFPITGGNINGSNALLFHDGSGILFSSSAGSLGIGDFVVDTANASVTGSANVNGSLLSSVPLFTIGAGTSLSLTSEAAGAFQSVFGITGLSGTNVGFATPNPVVSTAPVPEPATWAMMLVGFGACGVALRRSRRRFAFA